MSNEEDNQFIKQMVAEAIATRMDGIAKVYAAIPPDSQSLYARRLRTHVAILHACGEKIMIGEVNKIKLYKNGRLKVANDQLLQYYIWGGLDIELDKISNGIRDEETEG